jgi:hypothetical protein
MILTNLLAFLLLNILNPLGHAVTQLMGEVIAVGEAVDVATEVLLVQAFHRAHAVNVLLLLGVHVVLKPGVIKELNIQFFKFFLNTIFLKFYNMQIILIYK